jgi:hypothetical protein
VFGDNTRLRKHRGEHGQQAEAEVLSVKKQHWGPAQGGAGGDAWGTHQAYKLKLRVSPPGEPAFEVEISDAPLGVPEVGKTLPVLFDPKHHSKVVLDLDFLNRGFAAGRRERGAVSGPPADLAASIRETVRERMATPEAQRQAFHLGPETAGAQASGSSGGLEDLLAAASGAASNRQSDTLDQLAKLADLHGRGVLTDAEFEAQKAKILGES